MLEQACPIAGAMEDLPSELLQIIVQKLALQTPTSLLRATCACKRFQEEVESNPGIWRKGFLGNEQDVEGLVALEKRSCKDGSGKLEAKILELTGGYKSLVIARLAGPRSTTTPEQNQSLAPFLDHNPRRAVTCQTVSKSVRYLVLLRHHAGRIMIWRIDAFTPEPRGEDVWCLVPCYDPKVYHGSGLTLYVSGLEPGSLNGACARKLRVRSAHLMHEPATLEIYCFRQETLKLEKVGEQTIYGSWNCILYNTSEGAFYPASSTLRFVGKFSIAHEWSQ